MTNYRSTQFSALLACLALTSACNDDPQSGTLNVTIYGEEFIESGIAAAEFSDGWAIEFGVFEVSIGAITAQAGHGGTEYDVPGSTTYDLTTPSSGAGQLIASVDVEGGNYDHIAYRIEEIYVEGVATKAGQTKTFAWRMSTPTTYSHCASTAVVDGGVATSQLTIHADHLFYDDLVSAEPNLAFDLIASADDSADANGSVSQVELSAVDITGEQRYQVGNATDVTNLWQFIDRQASTVGHIDGEGHCEFAVRD